jgi:nucleoside-diphosphate-sugar epimerase
MKVLVTGATSMIGRVTVEALLARGDEVTTMQRSPSGLRATEVIGSVTDVSAAAQACRGQDAVIHLAAKVDIIGEWDDFVSVNVEGTNNMLSAAREAGVSGFVYVSSPSVAHGGESIVGEGAEPANPERTRGDYATSKAMAEQLAISASTSELAVVAIRPHLVIGPGDTQLVGRILERARQGRLPLIGSGLALIDTTWVDNAADALVAALDRAPQIAGRSFVVSNNEPRTVHELIARITAAAGVPWSPRSVPRRAAILGGAVAERVWDSTGRDGEPAMTAFGAEQLSTAHWFDLRTTREALDWKPKVSLSEGFELLASSFDNHHSS